MKEYTYRTHQKILGAIIIAYSALNLIGGVSVIAAINIINMFIDEPDIIHLVTFFTRLIGIILLVVSVPAFIAGVGLVKEKEWSKNLAFVVGIVLLIFFPVGTIIGIYSIWLNSQSLNREKEPVYDTDLVKHSH